MPSDSPPASGAPRAASSSVASSSASSPCSTMSPSWNRIPSAISRHSGVRRRRNSRSMQKCLNSSPCASLMIARASRSGSIDMRCSYQPIASASSVREAQRRAKVRVRPGSSEAGSWYWSNPTATYSQASQPAHQLPEGPVDQLGVIRRLVPPLLAPGVAVVVLDRAGAASELVLFVLAAAALVPLAWLIGEATEQAAHFTGPGIGGFLNASFGNAPELIIALVAISDGLTNVVRASLAGSIVGNLLLVLGFTLLVARPGTVDRTSAFVSLATIAVALVLLLIPSLAGWG